MAASACPTGRSSSSAASCRSARRSRSSDNAGSPGTLARRADSPARSLRRGAGPQIREDGEHAPVILVGGGEVELHEDVADVRVDRLLGEDELLRDRVVRLALGDQREDLAFTVAELT